MLVVNNAAELAPYKGKEIGVSEWIGITAPMILDFGRITRNEHWVHSDAERARRETPYGGIIAHGFFTLALINPLLDECVEVKGVKRWTIYGVDKLRFTKVVKADERVRLKLSLRDLEQQKDGAMRLVFGCVMEIEGSERPALVADYIMIAYH